MSAIKDSHTLDPQRGTHGERVSHKAAGAEIASAASNDLSPRSTVARGAQPPVAEGGRCLGSALTLGSRHVVARLSKAQWEGNIGHRNTSHHT